MSEKKVGKRLLTWVLVLIMALSMLPLNVLAAEVSEKPDVVQGHYNENGVWTEGALIQDLPNGVDSVSKTAEPTGNSNEYTVTLQVQTRETTTVTSPEAAAVLVIDISNSMKDCLETGHWHDLGSHKNCKSRLDVAKDAATSFVSTYAGTVENSGRYLAIVLFNYNSHTDLKWTDVSTSSGKQTAIDRINNIGYGSKDDGGTNLEQGLALANDLLTTVPSENISVKNKNVIALTDGAPTRAGTNSDTSKGSAAINAATADTASAVKLQANLYTVCFGAESEYTWEEYIKTGFWEGYWEYGPTVGDFLRDSIASGSQYAFNANNRSELNRAFSNISEEITSGLSSGTVYDSLPKGVTPVKGFDEEWELKPDDADVDTSGATKTYTYTKTYTVTIDPTDDAVAGKDYYPLNGPTTLTVKDSTGQDVRIDFPIPAGKVTLQKYKVEYTWTNAPEGVTLPTGTTVTHSAPYTVDSTYSNSSTVEVKDAYGNVKGIYTFSGWNQTGEITITEDTIITGTWSYEEKTVPTHKVEYTWTNAPEGVTLPTEATVTHNAPYTVDSTYSNSSTVEVKDAYGNVKGVYTFGGWNQTGDITITADTVITGTWSYEEVTVPTHKVEYTWTNAPEGVTLPTGTTVTHSAPYTVDSTYSNSSTVEVKDAYGNIKGVYTFGGWNQTGEITITADTVITGTWSYEKKYTVKYDLDGGTTTSDKTIFSDLTYNTDTPTIANPTKAGYTFAGWEPKVANKVTDNATYTAKWTRNYTPRPYTPPTVVIPDDDALGLNTTDHFAYIVGYGNGEVRPQNNITRAEVATIFFRLLTDDVRDENLTKTNRYSDVAATSWYNTAVSTLSSMGIITGYPDGTFRPNAAITRAEFAAIAARFDNDGDKTAAKFSDIATHWAKDEISIAYNNGWITGYPNGTFGPQRDITRAETMTLVNRVLNRQPETEDDLLPNMTVWTDNANPKAWYYLAVQEATNSHYYKFKTNSKYEKWTELRETCDWTQLEK